MSGLFDAFVAGAGNNNMVQEGTYNLAIETTLPLQNTANATVTNFSGNIELMDGTMGSIIGTAGADAIVGTAASEFISSGAGKDTILTGAGSDYIILATGVGSTTLANTNTVTGHVSGGNGFTNGTDKFALDGLTFAQLTIGADATNAAHTNVSITATGEYLMQITDLSYGYIDTNDFILTSEIV